MDTPLNIAVAMSGGVDSSTVAALLQQQGHTVQGFTMLHTNLATQAVDDAAAICQYLGIKHTVLDLRHQFDNTVIDYFCQSYKNGLTPNPCVECNRQIKFGLLLDTALKAGADKLATGHYARLVNSNNKWQLWRALNRAKDQTYMLWQLTQQQLSRAMFPLAALTKDEVRQMAADFKLPVIPKGESQDICFINGEYTNFLAGKIDVKPGPICLPDGQVIGTHKGLPFYTVGQRKGLNTPWHSALYVMQIDVANNRLVVTTDVSMLECQAFTITKTNFVQDVQTGNTVQIRYRSKPQPVQQLSLLPNGDYVVQLQTPAGAVTPGQSAVFYQDNQLIGGGIIVKANA